MIETQQEYLRRLRSGKVLETLRSGRNTRVKMKSNIVLDDTLEIYETIFRFVIIYDSPGIFTAKRSIDRDYCYKL